MPFRSVLPLTLALLFPAGCAAHAEPTSRDASATEAATTPLALADALEEKIERGVDTPELRRAAHARASELPAKSAEDALGRAIVAGRLAQLKGLSAPGLVREVEHYARLSAKLDPTLRYGAAWRILGTLYVMAPAALVEHGDSETGLELLQQAVRKWPDHPENHLRLAEAYLTLGDEAPALPHLCFCRKHRSELRRADQRLLDELIEQAELSHCP